MVGESTLFHGTAVAIGNKAALIVGGSGSGKSDLALRFVSSKFDYYGDDAALWLVGDDQVVVSKHDGGRLRVRPHENLAGLIEVRGVGIVKMPYLELADLHLIVQLDFPEAVPRLPALAPASQEILGVTLPVLTFWAFENSAVQKLFLALKNAGEPPGKITVDI